VVLGPEKLPRVVAEIGRWVGRARAMARQFREQLEEEVEIERARRAQSSEVPPPTHNPTPPPPTHNPTPPPPTHNPTPPPPTHNPTPYNQPAADAAASTKAEPHADER
jgi:Sec-independent protein translocase protein TatA